MMLADDNDDEPAICTPWSVGWASLVLTAVLVGSVVAASFYNIYPTDIAIGVFLVTYFFLLGQLFVLVIRQRRRALGMLLDPPAQWEDVEEGVTPPPENHVAFVRAAVGEATEHDFSMV
eukprot:Trichotokara_eunicae@DN4426_c0_g1_i2.p1